MAARSGKFVMGRKFKSFQELEEEITRYSKATYCAFWKRDSRKIGGVAVPKTPKNIEPRLVYYEIKYTCIYGGRKIKRSGSPSQSDISTQHQNCPVKIYLRATPDGKSLEVRGLVTEHNHECSKSLYANLPLPRRMLPGSGLAVRGNRSTISSVSENVGGNFENALDTMKGNTKSKVSLLAKTNAVAVIKSKLSTPTKSKSTSLASRSVAKSKASSSDAKSKKMLDDDADKTTGALFDLWSANGTPKVTLNKDDLACMVQPLIDKYGCQVEMLSNEANGNFLGLYLQTPSMKRTVEAFPEFVAIDSTFSLLRTGVIPAYFCQVENGNCLNELVAVCLVVQADRTAFEWFVRVLDAGNPQLASRARYVLADRSLIQQDVLQQRFVGVPLLPAVFHASATFDRQLAANDMGLSKNQRIVCTEYFGKMVAATSEDDFDEQYERFRDIAPRAALSHYSSHWHPSRWEWSSARDAVRGHFLANVNAGLETLNRLLEAGTSRSTSLFDLLDRLLGIVTRMESERDNLKVSSKLQKGMTTPVAGHPPNSDEESFIELLNRHPARMVLKQMEYASQVLVPTTSDGHDCYRITTSEGTVVTTTRSCTCTFVQGTLLPCRHIFAVRRVGQVPCYDAGLCHERWTQRYYKNYCSGSTSKQPAQQSPQHPLDHPLEQPAHPLEEPVKQFDQVDDDLLGTSQADSSEEMMQEVLEVIESLADLTSREDVETIREHLNLLKILRRSWEAGRHVTLLIEEKSSAMVVYKTEHVEPETNDFKGLDYSLNGHSGDSEEQETFCELSDTTNEIQQLEPQQLDKRKRGTTKCAMKTEKEPPKKKQAKAR